MIANSRTSEQYEENLATLTDEWTVDSELQNWFENKWLTHKQVSICYC